MERQITDLEYSNTDATVEQVKAAIRAAKVIMQRPLQQPDGTSFSKNSVYFRRERCLPP